MVLISITTALGRW